MLRLRLIPLTILLGLLILNSCSASPSKKNEPTEHKEPLLHLDFESIKLGAFSEQDAFAQFKNLEWATIEDRAELIQVNKQRGQALRVRYPKNAFGAAEAGIQFVQRFPSKREAWLSYDLHFEEGFDFNRGGKLPGLTSDGSNFTGGQKPGVGDGWSARFMWRRGGAAVLYLYHIDMCNRWGDSLHLKERKFVPGKWHNIVQYIKLNEPNKTDGEIHVWLDQEKVLEVKNLRLQTGNSGLIDSFYFSSFHGGGNIEWAPSRTSYARFDTIRVDDSPTHMLSTNIHSPKRQTSSPSIVVASECLEKL